MAKPRVLVTIPGFCVSPDGDSARKISQQIGFTLYQPVPITGCGQNQLNLESRRVAAYPRLRQQPRLALPFDFAQGPRSRRGATPRTNTYWDLNNYFRTYANKPRNRVSHPNKTAKIHIFSSETRFLRKSYTFDHTPHHQNLIPFHVPSSAKLKI